MFDKTKDSIIPNTELPDFNFNHFMNMCDSIGIFQHAKYEIPDYNEGYCTDDNARLIVLINYLERIGIKNDTLSKIRKRALGFILYAFNSVSDKFRNFMNLKREWVEDSGSPEAHGRAMWALGNCVYNFVHQDISDFAINLFTKAAKHIDSLDSIRARAFIVTGLGEIHKAPQYWTDYFHGIYIDQATHLYGIYTQNKTTDWMWFENEVTYDNARLSDALILAGYNLKNEDFINAGLESLMWLSDLQLTCNNLFSPIGCKGFYRRYEKRAQFDQQPIEACAMITACKDAFMVTKDEKWLQYAYITFSWFLGHNDLNLPLYNHLTGGCYDGLMADGVNKNQGAESLLSYMISLAEIKSIGNHLA
jgi:hypothetical protein